MKKLLILIFVVMSYGITQAQTPVPFAYTAPSTTWAKLDSTIKVELNAFAKLGSYNDTLTMTANAILSTRLVHNVPSRSGKMENQVWMQFQTPKRVINCIFALNALPTITEKNGVLTISGHRGDKGTSFFGRTLMRISHWAKK